MVDIVLINARDMVSRYPYLGISYLASALEEKGFNVKIIDAAALNLDYPAIATMVKDESPKIVGITTMSMTLAKVYPLIQVIKKLERIPEIVVGGTHISADPAIIEIMGVKYGFTGECERVFPIFCEHLLQGNESKVRELPGLVVVNNKLAVNKPEIIENLDTLSFPARHLLPNNRYYSPNSGGRVTSMLGSRGCPFNCIFCSSLSKVKVRFRSPENVLEEIKEVVYKYNCKYIEFVDELFTMDKTWVTNICELVMKRGIKVKWGCGTRANLVDRKLVKEMAAAGCKKITFGVETGSERIRMLINKRIRNSDYVEAFKMCREMKIEPAGGFILGHPTETREDLECSIQFAKELNARITPFTKTIILPASPLFDKAVEEGKIKSDVWHSFMLGMAEEPHYVPDTLTEEEMTEVYRKALRSFYYRPRYILARLMELRSFADLKNIWFSFVNLIVFLKRYQ